MRGGAMRRLLMLTGVLVLAVAMGQAQPPAPPQALSTPWEVPPGDPLEHMTAGFAKILCSALFITGRDLATAAEEDGFFVAPRTTRGAVVRTVVDTEGHAVHLTLQN